MDAFSKLALNAIKAIRTVDAKHDLVLALADMRVVREAADQGVAALEEELADKLQHDRMADEGTHVHPEHAQIT